MTETDVAAVRQLDEAVFPDPWTEAQLSQSVANPQRVHVVSVNRDEAIVGHAELFYVAPDATLTTIAVASDAQRGAVATRLLLHLFAEAVRTGIEAVTLEVRATNKSAHALYRRFGFAPSGVRRGYYRAGGDKSAEDALIMWAHDIHLPDYQDRLDKIADRLAVGGAPART